MSLYLKGPSPQPCYPKRWSYKCDSHLCGFWPARCDPANPPQQFQSCTSSGLLKTNEFLKFSPQNAARPPQARQQSPREGTWAVGTPQNSEDCHLPMKNKARSAKNHGLVLWVSTYGIMDRVWPTTFASAIWTLLVQDSA